MIHHHLKEQQSTHKQDPKNLNFLFKKMTRGSLGVHLIAAKGLDNSDFLCNMDPYVIITCRTQEKKSSVASGMGSEPEWNENFVFSLSSDVSELSIKIMDSDAGSADDIVGEAKIPLDALFEEGSIPPTSYNVVKDEEFCGEIRVGLTFTPEAINEGSQEEESYGGWTQSSYQE
ncbi:elicitor-responsive protein 3 isoform X2 [Daucus carota subsp. sativus]|uniref:elicitor-responsive protein 3 isoform X2 n=1 Tax=Daucus carota subsp. sativus TaxID=79200 RepID=UPI003083615A